MAKHNYTFDHPSDIGLAARADSLGELMEALAEGLAGEICDRDQVRAVETRTLEVSVDQTAAATPDYEALAVDFLTAVMNLIQVRHFMVREASVEVRESGEPRPGGSDSSGLSCEPRPGGSGFSELSNTNSQDHSLPVAARQNLPEETTGPLTSVRGSLTGEPYDPARHEIKVEIKAVTYHQLTIKQEGGQWVGRVIVDI